MSFSNRAFPFFVLVILGIIWGLTIPLVKIALNGNLKPFGITFWEVVIVAIVLGIICLVRHYKISIKPQHLKFCFVISILGTLFPNAFSYVATAQLPAGIMAIIIATVPMCAMLIALGLGVEKFSTRRMLGVVLGLAAMTLIALPQLSLPEAGKALFILIAFVAPLSYGIESNFISIRAPHDINAIVVLFVSSLIAIPISYGLASVTGQFYVPGVFSGQGFSGAELAVLVFSTGHAIAYAGYIWLVGFSGPVFAAQIAYIVTITGVVASTIMLGEEYAHTVWMSLAMVLVGLMLVQPAKEKN